MSKAPRAAAARRDWGSDDTGCHILHVDMDAFFAAVEIRDNPELRGKPVLVGGQERGVVTAASYEARAYGVRSAMPMVRALRACPHAVVVRPRISRYREVSEQVMDVLGEITPILEKVSVDEAYLDVSGSLRRLGTPTAIGHQLRRQVRERTGITASVGIASTKVVAKLASNHAKPDGLLLVPHARSVEFLHVLPAGALPGVGERTAEILSGLGVRTVADIAAVPGNVLERRLGPAAAQHLQALARGDDPRPVVVGREEKSVGTESTFGEDIADREELERVLLRQAHETAARLRADGAGASGVAIKVRYHDFSTRTRSRTLPAPTNLARDLYTAACGLLAEVPIPPGGVRLLGIRAERLSPIAVTGMQAGLDDPVNGAAIEHTLDTVVRCFGPAAVAPASLLPGPNGRSPLPRGRVTP